MSRGGAGNIEAAAAATRSIDRDSHDLEAQRLNDDYVSTSAAIQSKKPAEYAHTGRGGAGNYYSPKELSQTGSFQVDEPVSQTRTSTSTPSAASATPSYRGRGGAGNYEMSSAEKEALRRTQATDQAYEQEKLHQTITQDVEAGLARPERARLSGLPS